MKANLFFFLTINFDPLKTPQAIIRDQWRHLQLMDPYWQRKDSTLKA